jgi:hypothetical protein
MNAPGIQSAGYIAMEKCLKAGFLSISRFYSQHKRRI